MIEYLARRLVYIVPLLFLVTLVTFSVALLLPGDPALAYIEETLLPLDEAEIMARCQEWSVEPDRSPVLRRDEAIQAWQLRTRLSPESQLRYDSLGVTARRQIVNLHDQVLTANPADVDSIAHLLPR